MSRTLDRRAFLRTSAAIAAVSLPPTRQLFGRLDARLTRTGAPQKIIIIGAGMAGLTAATELLALGHRVGCALRGR